MGVWPAASHADAESFPPQQQPRLPMLATIAPQAHILMACIPMGAERLVANPVASAPIPTRFLHSMLQLVFPAGRAFLQLLVQANAQRAQPSRIRLLAELKPIVNAMPATLETTEGLVIRARQEPTSLSQEQPTASAAGPFRPHLLEAPPW